MPRHDRFGHSSLGLVHEPGKTDAATSECRYAGKDGGVVATLMTRWSPIGDNTVEAIAQARSAAQSAARALPNVKVEDVAGLGKAAFFTPKIDQLTAFLDDARMITVTPTRLPGGVSGKDAAIALAKKAGARGS